MARRLLRSFSRCAFGLPVVIAVFQLSPAFASAPSFEERVAAQRAIEQVYWDLRIWPQENPGSKPALDAVLGDATIRERVEDYFRKSNASEQLWGRRITAAMLQAELARMAEHTRDPQTLVEIFAALGNDPTLIAETLARQTLADRLIRALYARDTRFHGELRRAAEAARAACHTAGCMEAMGGEYHRTRFRLRGTSDEATDAETETDVVLLDQDAWTKQFGAALDALPIGELGDLEETEDAFLVTAVLSRGEAEVETATAVWPKPPFDSWWSGVRGSFAVDLEEVGGTFTFVAPSGAAGCDPDTWSPTHSSHVPESRWHHTAVWTGAEMIVWGGTDGYFLFDTGSRYNPATDTWSRLSAASPEGRMAHSAVWTGTEMIVWGGWSALDPYDTGGRYDPSTDRWSPTSTGANVPFARGWHTAVWTGTQMIVWGGDGPGGGLHNTGGLYDPATDTWEATPTTGDVPHPRSRHTAVWTGAEMIVWGGYDFQLAVSTGGRYNPSTNTWVPVSNGANVPAARAWHTAVWTGTQMIVWGGDGSGGHTPLNTGGRYDPSTDTWAATSTGANVPAARATHVAVWTGARMIVWGGANDNFPFNTGGQYDPLADTWTPTSAEMSVPTERMFHTAVWTGTEMIVWGGHLASDSSAGGRYNPSSDTWMPTMTEPNVPSPRLGNTAVWTGAEMIVWGGSGSGLFRTGARYVPATDSWTPTSVVSAPAARAYHTAVWTGTEMIVWGGHARFNPLNTGGRYDPVTDGWTPTSTGADVPSPRRDHTAVWTGTEMIVWGGNGNQGNSGGRYDPATNTWTPTSTGAGVPAPRRLHSAVWTGTEMIVWGGNTGLVSSTGGRYDPATDSWTPTSTGAGVPSPRSSQTAVWTGAEMIVWGGWGNDVLNTGGRYDPATDSWTPTSLGAGVPAARFGHSAVWTGMEMIVWGGGFHVIGGRYDPTANAWTPTSTGANTPSSRHGHTAVWTGTQMIVWGGYPLTTTGGLYCVCASTYLDADLDGYGDPAVSAPACDGSVPAGHVTNHADCNDANDAVNPGSTEVCNGLDDDCDGWVEDDFDLDGVAACLGDCDESNADIYPGAPEINDGLDNQCPGEAGYEVVDEIAPGLSFDASGVLSWPAQVQATLYQYARASTPHFAGDCVTGFVADASWHTPDTPPADGTFFYLVRAVSPWLGSWGRSSDGTERTVDCVGETTCSNGSDDEGDGLVDCLDPDCDGVAGCELGGELTCDDGLDNDADGAADCLDADCASPPISSSPVSQSGLPATSSLFASAANAWDGNPGTYAFCSYAWPALPAGSCGGQFAFATGGPASGHIDLSVSHVFQTCAGSATEASYSLDGGGVWLPFVNAPGGSSTQTYSSPPLSRVSLGSLRVRVMGRANCVPPGGSGTTGTIRLYELRFVDEGVCPP